MFDGDLMDTFGFWRSLWRNEVFFFFIPPVVEGALFCQSSLKILHIYANAVFLWIQITAPSQEMGDRFITE